MKILKILHLFTFYLFCWTALPLSAQGRMIDVSFEPDSNLPIVYINVAIQSGAVTDSPNQSGMTNFMGEMLLRGTHSHTKEQLDARLDQMGAKLEVETRTESLIFRGAVLSTQLNSFLSLLHEILTQPAFPNDEIRKLKSEMISSIEEGLGHDGRLASQHFNRLLFQGHPYGNLLLGRIQDIRLFSRGEVIRHYHKIVRQPIFVVGSGDATSDRISSWAASLNPSIDPSTPLPKDSGLSAVPIPQDAEHRRFFIIDKPDRTQTQINVGQIGVRLLDADYFPLHVGNHAFGGPSFSAILMSEIRVKRGWSYGASSAFKQGLQPRSWHYHIFPAEKDTVQALAYSLECVEKLRDQGLTSEQFTFAKQSLVNSSGFMFNTPKKRVENKLIEKTLSLPDGFMSSFGAQIEKVSRDDVNRALKKFLHPEALTIVVLGTAQHLKEPIAHTLHIPTEQIEIVPYTAN